MKTVSKSTGNMGLDILMQELDLALAFLNVANATTVPESARRNQDNAVRAYRQVVGALQAVTLSEEVQEQFDEKLDLVMSRLRESGANTAA